MADDVDRANDLMQLQIKAAISNRHEHDDEPSLKPCTNCNQRDWRTREGYALCDDCQLAKDELAGEAS